MGRYRKILVPVDGSDSSKNAFRQACRIVREDKSWITVITTIPLYQDQFDVLSTKEMVGKLLHEEAEKILSGIRNIAEQEDIYISTQIEEGIPFQCIIDVSEVGGYDLIVMGRHGTSRVERALMGSVTARVIGNGTKDVLVVPENTSIGWDTIVLATDGSRYSVAAADKALNIAASYGGAITAVSVVDVNDEFLVLAPEIVEKLIKEAISFTDNFKERAMAANIKTDAIVREGETAEVITELAGAIKADMIIMGSHGKTGVKKFLMGSVTEKVIGSAPCPVMVVRIH